MHFVNVEMPLRRFSKSPSQTSSHYLDFLLNIRSSLASTSSTYNVGITHYFNDFEKQILYSVLQNCLDKLYLLLHVFPLNSISLRIKHLVNYDSLQDRIEGEYCRFNEIRETLTDKDKFQRDLYMVRQLLKKGQREILTSGNYLVFAEAINGIERCRKDEDFFISQYDCNKAYLQELKEQLKDERKKFKEAMVEINKRIYLAESNIGHEKAIMRFKKNYNDKWEKSRQWQSHYKFRTISHNYAKMIKSYRKSIKNENFIHNEIEKFLTEQYEDCSQLVQKWTNSYEKDIEKHDMEIYNLKVRKELLSEQFVTLQKEYENRKIAIAEWLVYKEKKRKEEEERLRQESAALRIQAWWRGAMVRRCLGEVKRKKKVKSKVKNGTSTKKAKGGKLKVKK